MKQTTFQSRSYSPDIYITVDAKRKLDLYIQCATGEISGLGSVMRSGDDLLIYDIFLFEQVCSPTETDINRGDIHQMLYQAVVAGLDTSVLKLWWHSHVKMATFWSQTDENTAVGLARDGWFLSIVGNQGGEYLCRIDVDQPVPITVDGLELKVHFPVDDSMRDEIAAEVRMKVTVKPLPKVVAAKGVVRKEEDDNGYWYGGLLETT